MEVSKELKQEQLVNDTLNKRIEKVESLMKTFFEGMKIKYATLNTKIPLDAEDKEFVLFLEKAYPELTVGGSGSNYWVSTFSVFSTITRILTGKPMSFIVDEERNIIGVKFISETPVKKSK